VLVTDKPTDKQKENVDMKRYITLLIFLLVLSLLGACGGGDAANTPPATEPPAPTEAEREIEAEAGASAPESDTEAEQDGADGDSAAATATPPGDTAAAEELQDELQDEPEATATLEPSTPTQVTPPTDTPIPTPEQVTLEEVDATEGLEQLESYRMHFVISLDGVNDQGEDQSGTIDMIVEKINASRHQRIKMTLLGSVFDEEELPVNEIEMIQPGEWTYMVMTMAGADEPLCIKQPSEGEEPLPINPNEMLNEFEDVQLSGRGEEVNGIVTDLYSFDVSAVGIGEEIEAVNGGIWIAQEGGYLVKLEMEATGKGLEISDTGKIDGTVSLNYDLTEVNAIETIELPPACDNALGDTEEE
jgi:hypothetical protein